MEGKEEKGLEEDECPLLTLQAHRHPLHSHSAKSRTSRHSLAALLHTAERSQGSAVSLCVELKIKAGRPNIHQSSQQDTDPASQRQHWARNPLLPKETSPDATRTNVLLASFALLRCLLSKHSFGRPHTSISKLNAGSKTQGGAVYRVQPVDQAL